MKVAGTILFFHATLGLNDSLRHLQGLQAAILWKNEKPFKSCNIANTVSIIQPSFDFIQKSQIVILLLDQTPISDVFQLHSGFAGDQKTALTGESLYKNWGQGWF